MTDPIGRFTQVNSIKSQTANDEAMDGAEKQKELIDQKKALRAVESQFETTNGTGRSCLRNTGAEVNTSRNS